MNTTESRPTPPRPNKRFAVLVLPVFILGLGAVLIFGTTSKNGLSSTPVIAMLCGTIGLVMILAVVLAVQGRKHARLVEEYRASLAVAMGVEYVGRPTKEQKHAVFASVRFLKSLRNMPGAVKWYMTGRVNGRGTLLVFHQYVVSHGHGAHAVSHAVALTACPKGWPELRIHQSETPTFDRWGLGVIRRLLGGRKLELENEQFNRRWTTKCDSEDFALCALTPEVQQWFAQSPREAWNIGRGVACCVRTRLAEADIEELIRRPSELLSLMEPGLTPEQQPAAQR